MLRRRFATALIAVSATGCSLAPKSFRDVVQDAPLVRARSIGMSRGLPDAQVIPVLVDRLEDPDPVVRLKAADELKQRTGQDFGYVSWAEPAERAAGVAKWRAWLNENQTKLAGSRDDAANDRSRKRGGGGRTRWPVTQVR